MSNISLESDYARAILKTYHQVNDTSYLQQRVQRTQTFQKTKELETELSELKEKYTRLQNELSNKDERLARLNRQLVERNSHIDRLQEDFENAIYQLNRRV